MVLSKLKLQIIVLCATVMVGVIAYAKEMPFSTTIQIGVFSSQKQAQLFFEALPQDVQSSVDKKQLWLNAYKSKSGFVEHQLEVTGLTSQFARKLCEAAQAHDAQCISAVKFSQVALEKEQDVPSAPKTRVSNAVEKPARVIAEQSTIQSPRTPSRKFIIPQAKPLGIRVPYDTQGLAGLNLNIQGPKAPDTGVLDERGLRRELDDFTLNVVENDSLEAQAAKAAYDSVRNKFITAIQNIGNGMNADNGAEAARAELMAMGQELFEAAGRAYLSGFLEREVGKAQALSSDSGAGEAFIHHVKQNFSKNARVAIEALITQALAGAHSDQDMGSHALKSKTDDFILSSARGFIDAGLSAARRSDLFALRNMELEYNLNNFESSYFSVLLTQPIYQSKDLRHNVFLQGGGILNEQSVDVDDDVARHTLNVGGAYRYLTVDEKYLLGANVFYDHQWPYNHSRISIGADARSQDLSFAANYYYPITNYRSSRRDSQGGEYEERALEGYDIELGYTLPFLRDLSIFGKGYQYFRETDDDIFGLELSAEYNIRNNFVLTGSVIEENGGRDGVEIALQYRMPLYDPEQPNMVLADIEPAAGFAQESMRSQIFNKVRRENRIRVEERLKVDDSATIITAEFNALSTGIPFDVAGTLIGAGVDLPFDQAITIPNGDFGIINFSNGAIANISASGAGDVVLQFNETTLTVTATNGGFVQFISGAGGISTVNVPGGTVNLLGTDIDVTDDGTTTTIQVRAGQVEVVPDVGATSITGDQADVISLTIGSGATALLVDPALETRQEAAYSSLDLINPDPPISDSAAPFINVAPALITGPQFVGNNADIRLTFTKSVTVSGTPSISGLVDANARTFTYNAAESSDTQLVFRHVFLAADVGAAAITVQSLDLNGGTITDTNNALNALTAFTDTVVAITDLTTPTLVSSTPVDGEAAFGAASNIVLNFDEDMQVNIGNIILTDTTDGSNTLIIPITDSQVSISGSTVTIDPSSILDLSSDYDLVIGENVLQDTNGNAFAGIASGALNFTTSNDITPPVLTSSTPADNDVEIARSDNIVLNFDDIVLVGSGNITIHRTADDSVVETIAVGSANVTGGGTATITIDPSSDFPAAAEIYVLIPGTAFSDINGNDFAGVTATTDLSFSTFSPADLSNLTLWLDGEDLDGDNVPEGSSEDGISGGEVVTWVNKAGGGNVTSTAGMRPDFADPGAQFIGTTASVSTGDFMQINAGGASGQTIVFVMEGVSQGVSGNVNPLLDSSGPDYTLLRVAGTDYKISFDGTTNSEGQFSIDGDSGFIGPGEDIGSPGPFPTDALLYAEYSVLGTNHEILGGLSSGTGAVDTTPDYRANYIIREAIMYSDTKTSNLAGVDEREKIEGYLAHKYNIESRLPASHPFKTTAP